VRRRVWDKSGYRRFVDGQNYWVSPSRNWNETSIGGTAKITCLLMLVESFFSTVAAVCEGVNELKAPGEGRKSSKS
jgi:hypothetical protein